MNHFDVILLRDVIWAFGPKVTRRVTYNAKCMTNYKGINYLNTIFLNGSVSFQALAW